MDESIFWAWTDHMGWVWLGGRRSSIIRARRLSAALAMMAVRFILLNSRLSLVFVSFFLSFFSCFFFCLHSRGPAGFSLSPACDFLINRLTQPPL